MLKRILFVLVPVVVLIVWLMARGTPPPEVTYVHPIRETIVSTLTTNGKVEPVDWAAVNTEVAGPVLAVPVERGQKVHKGQILATIGSAEAQAELAAAGSRVDAARAEVQTVESGGRAPDRAEIESGLARARADLATAQNEAAALERLVAKNAATQAELTAARDAVQKAQLQIQSYERRRESLVTQPDRRAAQARLEEAQSGLAAARRRITNSQVLSPMDGILYSLDLKARSLRAARNSGRAGRETAPVEGQGLCRRTGAWEGRQGHAGFNHLGCASGP